MWLPAQKYMAILPGNLAAHKETLMNLKFHHLGYATRSIRQTAAQFTRLGYSLSDVVSDPIQGVHIAFLNSPAGPCIELVEGINPNDSPVKNTLAKAGVSPYHICYEVKDLNAAIAEFKAERYILLFNPVPAAALNNRRICYLFHKDIGLIELLEAI